MDKLDTSEMENALTEPSMKCEDYARTVMAQVGEVQAKKHVYIAVLGSWDSQGLLLTSESGIMTFRSALVHCVW